MIAFQNSAQAQRMAMQTAAARVGVAFVIPDAPVASGPDHVLKALEGAAKDSGVNVFRTQLGYTAQGDAETKHYVLLVGATDFFTPFALERGRVLAPSDVARRHTFMATQGGPSADLVGVIADLGHLDNVRIQPFATVYDSLPTAGLYYLEPAVGTGSVARFESRFLTRLNGLSPGQTPLTLEQLRPSSSHAGSSDNGLARLLMGGQGLFVVITLVLLAYYQLAETKCVAVLRLHGYGSAGIWWAVAGRIVVTTLGGAAVVLTLASRLVPGATWGFSGQIGLRLLIATTSMVFVSLVVGAYLFRVNLCRSLKNRKDTNRVFAFNTGLKAASSVALVVTGAGLLQQYHLASLQRATLGDWSATRGYGVFYPSSVGNDAVELAAGLPGPAAAEVFDLYPTANARGALYVDATQYESVAMTEPTGPGAYRSLTVNPNYLRHYPLRGVDGAQVVIPESTTDWVLLVPTSLRSSEASIRRYFQMTRRAPDGSGVR